MNNCSAVALDFLFVLTAMLATSFQVVLESSASVARALLSPKSVARVSHRVIPGTSDWPPLETVTVHPWKL